MTSLPLARFKVLDLTRVRAGPTCVRQLADWGADVIKIEAPPSPEAAEPWAAPRHGSDFQNLHRNKRGLTLDLKAPEGSDDLPSSWSREADVLVENYRPDVKHRLGIDYETLGRSTRASSMPASPASARTAPIASGPASTRSRRAWAA